MFSMNNKNNFSMTFHALFRNCAWNIRHQVFTFDPSMMKTKTALKLIFPTEFALLFNLSSSSFMLILKEPSSSSSCFLLSFSAIRLLLHISRSISSCSLFICSAWRLLLHSERSISSFFLLICSFARFSLQLTNIWSKWSYKTNQTQSLKFNVISQFFLVHSSFKILM